MAKGINVLLAGLAMQLASSAFFLATYWYFVYKLHHRRYVLDPTFRDIYLSPKFRTFLLCTYPLLSLQSDPAPPNPTTGMQLSTLLILARTAVRFASLVRGLSNPLNQSQPLTLVLDGVLILIAAAILTSLPPGSAFRSAWHATSPQPFFFFSSRPRSSGRRNGYRRPANISLPVPAPPPLPHAYSPGSPPYHPVGGSSPGYPVSPPLPTPPLHTFTPRSPPYHPLVGHNQHGPVSPPYYSMVGQQQQQQQQVAGPVKTSPGFARAPYGHAPGTVPSPGHSGGRQGFVPSHRRQQASTSLVNSDALW